MVEVPARRVQYLATVGDEHLQDIGIAHGVNGGDDDAATGRG